MNTPEGSRGETGARGWVRRLADGLTIMAGILAALGADAAWGWVGDRRDEAEYIVSLRAEFEEARSELAADQTARREMLRSARLVLDRRREGAPFDAEEVAEVTRALLDWRFYTPSHPVLEELTSAGRSGLIRSDRLRFLLRQYEQERERLVFAEEIDTRLQADRLGPFMATTLDLAAIRVPGEAGVGPGPVRAFNALTTDPHFGSLVFQRYESVDNATRFAGGLAQIIDAVLEALDTE